MSLAPLAVLYAVVGAGCVAAFAIVHPGARGPARAPAAARITDAALLLCLWPLYGPVLLLRDREPMGASAGADTWAQTGASRLDAAPGTEAAFLAALRRAADTPLGAVLPDQATARALAARLRVARAKVHEIDHILTQPAFDDADAHRRLAALRARDASACAISTATLRLQNIRRLRALRNRFANELDEVGELIIQLTTQAEVVRLAGMPHHPDTGDLLTDPTGAELIRELVSRVEGLDQMLDDDPYLDEPPSTPA